VYAVGVVALLDAPAVPLPRQPIAKSCRDASHEEPDGHKLPTIEGEEVLSAGASFDCLEHIARADARTRIQGGHR
jgi:hypothetical protein